MRTHLYLILPIHHLILDRSFWASGTLLPLMEWCVNWLAEVTPAAVQDGAPSALLRFPIIFLYQTIRCPSYRGASASLTLSLSARKQVRAVDGT